MASANPMLLGYLRALAEFLAADTDGYGTSSVHWVVGDWQLVRPVQNVALPVGFLVPTLDKIKPQSGGVGGVDMHFYTVPMFIMDDLANYGPPVQVQNHWEPPGYANLMTLAEAVVAALRHRITAAGAARTDIPKFEYGPVKTDDTMTFRAARTTITAEQRVIR